MFVIIRFATVAVVGFSVGRLHRRRQRRRSLREPPSSIATESEADETSETNKTKETGETGETSYSYEVREDYSGRDEDAASAQSASSDKVRRGESQLAIIIMLQRQVDAAENDARTSGDALTRYTAHYEQKSKELTSTKRQLIEQKQEVLKLKCENRSLVRQVHLYKRRLETERRTKAMRSSQI